MGKRGPKPEPSTLKILRGNPGRRPVNETEPVLPPPTITPPASMEGRAREEWIRLCNELVAAGVLTVGDTATFETYCRLVADVDSYEQQIAKVGLENAHSLGYANYLLKLRLQKKQHAETLGLTPSSRGSVKATKPVTNKNPFAALRS